MPLTPEFCRRVWNTTSVLLNSVPGKRRGFFMLSYSTLPVQRGGSAHAHVTQKLKKDSAAKLEAYINGLKSGA
jgi:hypothetical protein